MDSGYIAPKVFISYSHDSQTHKDRVLDMANRLRSEGVDCQIDQYEFFPSEGWPRWMMNQLDWAEFVLVVCTEQYERRFRGIVATCREFEFRHGSQFSRLEGFEQLNLSLPTWDLISPLLEQAGHAPNSMGESLRELQTK
ncbi:MAG: toll/interleukin-1 receptor domain-containing protein [Hydrococcus sp. Prado102]|jgi:hypothetical protein|nr:toll/interleukin-1 receptor domain-containing protein [Hydrococcus sp. Prado102]